MGNLNKLGGNVSLSLNKTVYSLYFCGLDFPKTKYHTYVSVGGPAEGEPCSL